MSKKHKFYMRGLGFGVIICALILTVSRMNTPAAISDEEIISRARALGMIEADSISLREASSLNTDDDGNTAPVDDENGENGSTAADVENNSIDAAEGNPGTDTDGAEITDGTNTDASADTTAVTDGTDSNAATDTVTDTTAVTDGTNTDASADTTAVTDGTDSNAATDTVTDTTAETDGTNSNASTDTVTDTTAVTDGTGTGEFVVLTVERGNSSDVVALRAQNLGLVDDYRDFDKYLVNNGYAGRIRIGHFSIEKGSDYAAIARAITGG